MNSRPPTRVGDGVEADGQAQGVGLADDASDRTLGVLFGAVVAAKVPLVDVVGEHVPHGDEDGVFDGDDRLLFTQAGHQTGVTGAEVGAFPGAPGGHRGGTEGAAEPPVAVSAFSRVLSDPKMNLRPPTRRRGSGRSGRSGPGRWLGG